MELSFAIACQSGAMALPWDRRGRNSTRARQELTNLSIDDAMTSGHNRARPPGRRVGKSATKAQGGDSRWISRSGARRSRKPPRSSRTGAAGARTTRSARSTTSRREDIVNAAKLIRTGKVFALGIPLDRDGPQTGLFGGRFNPIHQMLATGTDAIAGQQDWNKIRYADDTLMLCVQGATHWDALGHIFYEDKAYNGHDAKLIDSKGPRACSASSIPRARWSAAACCSTSRATAGAVDERRREHLQRRAQHLRPGAERRNPQRRFRHRAHRPDGALPRRRRSGAATPAATRRASSSRTATGARRRRSPRSAPTPGASRCGRTRPPRPTSPGIGW